MGNCCGGNPNGQNARQESLALSDNIKEGENRERQARVNQEKREEQQVANSQPVASRRRSRTSSLGSENVQLQRNASYGRRRTRSDSPRPKPAIKIPQSISDIIKKTVNEYNNWTPMKPEETCCFVVLDSNSPEFQSLERLFKKFTVKFKICDIERIQNPYLYTEFLLKKLELFNRYNKFPNEKLLFHGTKHQYVDSISNNNFDWRLCGQEVGYSFGRGVYFSRISHYATHYCDKDSDIKVMLAVKVLITEACVGNPDMILPPNGFDTTQKKNGHVTVKYEDNEFYPAYKIYFKSNENIL